MDALEGRLVAGDLHGDGDADVVDRRRWLKKRGVLLASWGWALALGILLVLGRLGVARLRFSDWLVAAGVTALVQLCLWLVPHRGWDRSLFSWDPHYTHVPMLAAALLLGFYAYLVPRAGPLLLMGWFVALLFLAGLADLREVLVLSGMAAFAHGVGVLLRWREGFEGISLDYEAVEIPAFLAICAYAGLVFRRLRRERAVASDLRRELVRLAAHDPLTGLPNRRHFEELLRSELGRLRRYGGTCSVAMIDVDHFKTYNDTLGHVAGDRVLREVADVLSTHVREPDVVARYGGEEFAVLFVDTGPREAVAVMERLRAAIEAHGFPRADIMPEARITISAGVAGSSGRNGDAITLIDQADRAMYAAKNAGRNRVRAAPAVAL